LEPFPKNLFFYLKKVLKSGKNSIEGHERCSKKRQGILINFRNRTNFWDFKIIKDEIINNPVRRRAFLINLPKNVCNIPYRVDL
jgi:hypothetical protein